MKNNPTPFAVVNVPIESLKDRYSENWNLHFPKALSRFGSVHTVYPETELSSTVVQGQFLNVLETNLFKSKQMAEIIKLIQQGLVDKDTVIFFHDLWFPGIESLFYIRDALDLRFKVAGMFHAGTWDHFDFLSSKGMGKWGKSLEESWLSGVDLPLVSTLFHQEIIHARREHKPTIAPFPLWHLKELSPGKPKENIIVFPHRLADEKNPLIFDQVARVLESKLPDWKCVKSKDVCSSKEEYFALLERSRIAVSCAQQETWGIAQLEATAAGCIPVVPDALSYGELYPSHFKYEVSRTYHGVPINFDVANIVNKIIDAAQEADDYDLFWLHDYAVRLAYPETFFNILSKELEVLK